MNVREFKVTSKVWYQEREELEKRRPQFPKLTLTENDNKYRLTFFWTEFEVQSRDQGGLRRILWFRKGSRIAKTLKLSPKNVKKLNKWLGEDE